MKKIVMTASCFLCSLFLYSGTADAASLKNSYDLKNGSHINTEKVEIKGGQTKTTTLKVKDNGTFKIALEADNLQLKGNEQVKIKVANTKGKTLTTKYLKKNGRVYYTTDLKKGTYRITVSTKNIKKNTKRTYDIGFTLNKSTVVKADGKTVYDIVNTKNTTKIKFVNDKSQTVKIKADGSHMENGVIQLTDTNGKTIFKDYNNEDEAWAWHYLPKGTYYINFSKDNSTLHWFTVNVSKEYNSNVHGNAVSKDAAVNYAGKSVNFAYSDVTKKEKIQWLKVDTAKNDYAFEVVYVNDKSIVYANVQDPLENIKVYKEDGTKVSKTTAHKFTREGIYEFAKGTGIYYISIPTVSSEITKVKSIPLVGALEIGKERIVAGECTYYIAKSSGQKEVSGKMFIKNDSYVALTAADMPLSIYSADNKKITADKDGVCKLKTGIYTFKGTVAEANGEVEVRMATYQVKDLKANQIEYVEKKKTINLSGLKDNKLYNITAEGKEGNTAVTSIAVYENGKKIEEAGKAVYFNTKANKKYSVTITTKENQLVEYSYSQVSDFKDSAKSFTSTKKSAKTYTTNGKNLIEKGLRVNGKTTKWIKIKNTSKEKTYFGLAGYANQGEVIAKIYDSKGKLKKTLKVDSNKTYSRCSLAANQTYTVKVYSTDKKTKANTMLYARV